MSISDRGDGVMKRPVTAFFGGSFDPPHLGHLALARAALASGVCDRVMWVPAYSPPHKRMRERAPFADRLAMVELMIRDEPGMTANDIERRLALDPSYTIDVMAALERENPDTELVLLVGGDSLLELHLWYRAEELAERYFVVTYPRSDPDEVRSRILAVWPRETAEKLLSGVLDGKIFEISSTEIKKKMAKFPGRGDINSGALADAVIGYCRRRGLYTGVEEKR